MSNNRSTTHELNITTNSYFQLFKGRTDKVGLATSLSTSISSEEELLQHVSNHLNGTCRLGFYNLLPNGTCPWAMVEFEAHDGKPGLIDPNKSSLEFIEHLRSVGIVTYRERSKNPNGKSFHCWIFFDKPLSAKKIHLALRAFVKDVMNLNTEVFPKGYTPGSNGNFVWLPLFPTEDSWGQGMPNNRTVFIDETGNPFPDQFEFLNSIVKITEADIDRLIKEYCLNTEKKTSVQTKTKKVNELEQVQRISSDECESPLVDGLEKLRMCSFMKHCEDNAATLSEPLWYAWISNAVRCIGGRDYIHQYGGKHPGYNRIETEKKIQHALKDTGPMTHQTIEERGFECNCPKKYKAPISRVYYKDIPAEIERINAIEEDEAKLFEIQLLLEYWAKLAPLEKGYYKDIIKKALKLKDSAFAEYENKHGIDTQIEIDYERELRLIIEECEQARIPDEKQGEIIYDWLNHHGVKFFKDNEHREYIFSGNSLMTVAKNDKEFESFLYQKTGATTATKNGEVFIKVLQALIELNGKKIDSHTWIHTNLETNTIYFNLNNDGHQLVRITPRGVEVVENGSNPEQVLLQPSMKILPLQFIDLDDAEYKNGLIRLKELVIDNLACKESDRIFCYAWKIASMFVDYLKTTPHLRLEGDSASGKSTAMELLSYPLYGDDQKKIGTLASNYSDGAVNPLVLLDNIEVNNMSQGLQDFIITAVTGMTKEKRKQGTDRDIIQEKTKCLICTTGIENMSLNEVINRTYLIEFDKKVHGSSFSDSIFIDIKKNRNLIMSAEFQLVSKVLKKIEDKTWSEYTKKINTDFKDNSKERANSFMAIMVLIAEQLYKAWGIDKSIWDLVSEWIETQNNSAQMTTTDSNPILQYLGMLKKEAIKYKENSAPYKTWEFDIEIVHVDVAQKMVFQGYAKDVHSTFSKLCQKRSLTYAYKSAMQLGKRFKDSKEILKNAGWIIEPDGQNRRGGNYYTLKYGDSEFTVSPSSHPLSHPIIGQNEA